MLLVLITLTPGRRNKFIDFQKPKVRIAVRPIMDVKTERNLILELPDWAHRVGEFPRKWVNNPKYRD